MLAKENNLSGLEIEVDAFAVIQLISGQNTVNHSFGNILLDCSSLMQELDVTSIKHIYRDANCCAEVLANDTLILVEDFHIYLYMPSCVASLFHEDLVGVAYPRLIVNT